MDIWTPEDDALATREGWNVFETDNGTQLQRLDCPEDADGHELPPFFELDEDAIAHVVEQAYAGSETHAKALRLTENDPLVIAARA